MFSDALLYGILDTGYVDSSQLEATATALLRGGVDVLQLRAKDEDEAGVLQLLRGPLSGLPGVCRKHGVPLIINDFPRVALEVGADGVHVGQEDGSLAEVRSVVGETLLVGRSTHSSAQAEAALAEGFDYIGFGPLFPTPTKQGRPGIGLDEVAAVETAVGGGIPVFCIGGIKPENMELVLASGARRVVIVSALLQAKDVEAATSAIKARLK